MKTHKDARCRMGIPIGITISLIGLIGMVTTNVSHDWFRFLMSAGLFLLGGPFARSVFMIKSAHKRIDALVDFIENKK